jgi:flagellar protein FliS
MSAASPQAYLRTKVLTASPAELRLLLLDGAIRFAEQTRAGYESKDFEAAFDATTKCQAILTELLCSLQPKQNPELCERLNGLYTYMYKRLVEASLTKDAERVQEVVGLLQYDRETWSMLMSELKNPGGSSQAPESSSAPEGGGPRLSVQA